MFDPKDFYFQNYADWHHAITVRCKIDLTPDYIQSRISALQNPKEKSTQEFKSKYGRPTCIRLLNGLNKQAKENNPVRFFFCLTAIKDWVEEASLIFPRKASNHSKN